MDDLQQALAALGLTWGEVWRLTADRRAGTLVVVALDGRKWVGEMTGRRPPSEDDGRKTADGGRAARYPPAGGRGRSRRV